MILDYSSLPNSHDAERAVLGSCIRSQEALGTAIEILRPDDFHNTAYRTVFEILSSMYLADKKVDMVTVSEELKARNLNETLGGQMFIAGLMSSVTTTANIITHSEIVRDYAVRRRLIEAGNKIISLSNRTDNTTKSII